MLVFKMRNVDKTSTVETD
ncbi:23S rRNA methyltransferase attenuation leader peptide [Streptococcus sp. 2022WUSS037]